MSSFRGFDSRRGQPMVTRELDPRRGNSKPFRRLVSLGQSYDPGLFWSINVAPASIR